MVANIIFGTNHSATTQPPVSAAVLFILLCTITVLHCILRRQLRQYVQSGPHLTVVVQLHIGLSDSSSCVQEKINHDNTVTVASVQVSNYTSFPKESGCSFCFSQLSPSDLEKASDNDTFNGMILCLSTSDDVSLLLQDSPLLGQYLPIQYPGTTVNQFDERLIFMFAYCSMDLELQIPSQFRTEIPDLMPIPFSRIHYLQMTNQERQVSRM